MELESRSLVESRPKYGYFVSQTQRNWRFLRLQQ
jgi:DNA-binding FadR family transcriptional regulator